MSIVIDVREQNDYLKGAADKIELLSYDAGDGMGTASADFEVRREDGVVLRVERKAHDFTASWFAGHLERQCAAVDLLIVERDPLNDLDMDARKHLALLALHMPVITTASPEETMAMLRHLEHRPTLSLRPNKVKKRAVSQRQALLASLHGINTARTLQDGRTVGDVVEAHVDWPALAKSLHLDEVVGSRYGVGQARVVSIDRALRRGQDEAQQKVAE